MMATASGKNQSKKITKGKEGGGLRVVLYASSFFVIDGVTITLRALVRHICRRGGRVLIVLVNKGASEALVEEFKTREKGAEFLTVGGAPVPIPGMEYSYLGMELPDNAKRAILDFQPDVIHISNPDPAAGLLAKWINEEQLQLPLVASLHSHYPDLVNFYDWSFVRRLIGFGMGLVYDYVPVTYMPSQNAVDKTLSYGWATDLQVWGRGVDSNALNPSKRSMEWRRKHGVEDEDFCVLWIARLVPDKRPLLWGECVQKLADEALRRPGSPKRKVKGLCIGKGPQDTIDTLSAHPAVKFVGFLTGEELSTAFASGDVLLFPSEIETFGRVTLEANASGCPAIVDKGCGSHLVQDGINGFTVETGGGVDEYMIPLRKLYEDDELRTQMSLRARDMSLTRSEQGMVEDMENKYLKAMQAQKGKTRRRKKLSAYVMNETVWLFMYHVLDVIGAISMMFILLRHGKSATSKPEVKAFVEGRLPSILAYGGAAVALGIAFVAFRWIAATQI